MVFFTHFKQILHNRLNGSDGTSDLTGGYLYNM